MVRSSPDTPAPHIFVSLRGYNYKIQRFYKNQEFEINNCKFEKQNSKQDGGRRRRKGDSGAIYTLEMWWVQNKCKTCPQDVE